MRGQMETVRNALFGGAVAGAMLFGGSQAAAAPRAALDCTASNQIFVGTCPGPGRDCGSLCTSGSGLCSNGCCTCMT